MLRLGLIVALVVALGFLGDMNLWRFGGRYMLRDSDHADIMTSGSSGTTTRTTTILFVGNSFTFINDLPAMLVNIAASDPGNPTQLAVKAVTYPDADLGFLLKQTDALTWARAHRVDYVVLQDHSGWYAVPQWVARGRENATAWKYALQRQNAAPVLFESWADGAGSAIYTNPTFYAYGQTPDQIAAEAMQGTAALAGELGMPVVQVGRAFQRASKSDGMPDLYQADRHHPSIAGTYLAALTFYRTFTSRAGTDAGYRPWGMSAADKAALVRAAAGG